ncbi:hypothetical protein BDW22DRAFT_1000085 [Trametopsis cervina]|nr:hypothetical protein BDW22DRAFT_1000085 [Trametopsis cervina]
MDVVIDASAKAGYVGYPCAECERKGCYQEGFRADPYGLLSVREVTNGSEHKHIPTQAHGYVDRVWDNETGRLITTKDVQSDMALRGIVHVECREHVRPPTCTISSSACRPVWSSWISTLPALRKRRLHRQPRMIDKCATSRFTDKTEHRTSGRFLLPVL